MRSADDKAPSVAQHNNLAPCVWMNFSRSRVHMCSAYSGGLVTPENMLIRA